MLTVQLEDQNIWKCGSNGCDCYQNGFLTCKDFCLPYVTCLRHELVRAKSKYPFFVALSLEHKYGGQRIVLPVKFTNITHFYLVILGITSKILPRMKIEKCDYNICFCGN